MDIGLDVFQGKNVNYLCHFYLRIHHNFLGTYYVIVSGLVTRFFDTGKIKLFLRIQIVHGEIVALKSQD